METNKELILENVFSFTNFEKLLTVCVLNDDLKTYTRVKIYLDNFEPKDYGTYYRMDLEGTSFIWDFFIGAPKVDRELTIETINKTLLGGVGSEDLATELYFFIVALVARARHFDYFVENEGDGTIWEKGDNFLKVTYFEMTELTNKESVYMKTSFVGSKDGVHESVKINI